MILILSNPFVQNCMDEVIEWLHFYEKPFVRLNGLNDSELKLLKFTFEENINTII